jgi:glycosyltransferase involved in cell wall biosynthesis
MKLIVLIPAYNEEMTIAGVINEIPRTLIGIEQVEILVIDDGSTDNTVQISKDAGADNVVSHHKNVGVGAAFSTGLDNALKMGADIIVTVDADGQFNPSDIPQLIAPILADEADFVTATRFLDPRLEPSMPVIKKIGNKIFTELVNLLTGKKFTDTQCGFRAYSKTAALRLELFGKFTYTQEVFLDLAKQGLTIKEVALEIKGQRSGKSRVVNNIFSYGIKAIIIILRSLRDYKPLVFFGVISLGFMGIGLVIGLLLLGHWILTGHTSPYQSLTVGATALVLIGLQLAVLALLADMVGRQMKLTRDLLYSMKIERYKKH